MPASASIELMIVSPNGTIVATRWWTVPPASASNSTLWRRAPAVDDDRLPTVTSSSHASLR